MVVSLGPGKFYGRSLPRPRYYTDVKFNDARVDPPVPILDPLLAWANEAHWSMGGLSFKRLRLQGRIEGSVSKLRIEREKSSRKNHQNQIVKSGSERSDEGRKLRDFTESKSLSPPPAPIAPKRRRFMALLDEENEEEDGLKSVPAVKKRRLVKRLGDDFDRVASENVIDLPLKGKGIGDAAMKVVRKLRDVNNGGENESGSVKSTRSSPRLANKQLSP